MQSELNKLKNIAKNTCNSKLLSGFVTGIVKKDGINAIFEQHIQTSESENEINFIEQAAKQKNEQILGEKKKDTE